MNSKAAIVTQACRSPSGWRGVAVLLSHVVPLTLLGLTAKAQTSGTPARVVLSPGCDRGANVCKGWPLLLNVLVWRELPQEQATNAPPAVQPITLRSKAGSWPSALMVRAEGPEGRQAALPWHMVGTNATALTLGQDDTARVDWWLGPEETAALAEGRYTITVSFDPQRVEGLTHAPGGIQSDPYNLVVVKGPSPLDADMQSEKQLAMAQLALLQGDSARASDLVAKVLAADRLNVDAHCVRAAIRAREGDFAEAAASLDEALNAFRKRFPKAEPLRGLMAQRDAYLLNLPPPQK